MTPEERAELLKAWRANHLEHRRLFDEWIAAGYSHPGPKFPPIPDGVNLLRCEAKTRAGTPCKRRDVYLNGRCKLHGGMSTGPTSPGGKARCAMNGHCPKRKRTSCEPQDYPVEQTS